MLYGVVHIRYNDKKLLDIIRNWINEDTEEYGEVPERPNGPDCEKRSVSKKFEMEKRVNSGKPLRTKGARGILSQAPILSCESKNGGRCRD